MTPTSAKSDEIRAICNAFLFDRREGRGGSGTVMVES
jgi:hypothetical protein